MVAPESGSKPEVKGAAPRRRRSVPGRALILGVLAAVLIGIASLAAAGMNRSTPALVAPTAPPALTARGTIEPAARATIAAMNGGVVRALRVQVGQEVEDSQVIAQVSTPAQTELLVAPWRGTIMGLEARLGDTLMPGAAVAILGDLSRYQVETTDVDEYLIGKIHANQRVEVTVDALDGRKLEGAVDTVALAQRASGGVLNYPVVIRLLGDDPDLRPGMTVRMVFSPRGG